MSQESNIFDVRWNFHYESVFSMIQGLSNEDDFSDVTLVSCDEQLDYQVHKFVLSAVSPVFKEILLNNPHDHPLIYLNSVKERELQYLLQLSYFGRTTVYESQVDAFLKVLEEFQLSGIELPNRTKTKQTRLVVEPCQYNVPPIWNKNRTSERVCGSQGCYNDC